MPDNIVFSSNPANDLAAFLNLKKYSKVSVLLDLKTAELCYPELQQALPAHHAITVSDGEEFKNLQTCEYIWKEMTDARLDRHSVLVVIGGGVLGDMGGFCASTYKRGIDFILIPTTLLSQVDASIGGKLGVDFYNFKNHIGTFQIPALTILFTGFLTTLPYPERRSGFAEIVKHALIDDPHVWDLVRTRSLEEQPWDVLIKHSVEFKLRVVTDDPKEKGLRKILNAGHTIGHAIETHLLATGRKIMHGEAVAAGLVAESYVALKKGMLPAERFDEIRSYVLQVFGKLDLAEQDDAQIMALTLQDKKNKENKVLCVLLEDVGKPRFDCEISLDEVKQALVFYRSVQM